MWRSPDGGWTICCVKMYSIPAAMMPSHQCSLYLFRVTFRVTRCVKGIPRCWVGDFYTVFWPTIPTCLPCRKCDTDDLFELYWITNPFLNLIEKSNESVTMIFASFSTTSYTTPIVIATVTSADQSFTKQRLVILDYCIAYSVYIIRRTFNEKGTAALGATVTGWLHYMIFYIR